MDKQTKQQIQQWLAGGRDYNEGLMLFLKFSRNKNLARFLATQNERSAKMLPQEIAKIIGAPAGNRPAVIDGATPSPQPLRIAAGPKAKHAAKADENQYKGLITPQPNDTEYHTEARKELETAFRKRTSLHGQLEQVTDEEERHFIANEIVDCTEQIDYLIDALKHFETTNQWPADVQSEIDREKQAKQANTTIPASVPKGFNFKDMGKVVSRIATLRTYASRDKDKPEKLKKWEDELAFMEQVRDGIIEF